MKLVYASDLHGRVHQYEELHDLIGRTKPDALLLGGDFFQVSRNIQAHLDFAEHYLVDYLNAIPVPVYTVCGNTDFPLVMDYLRENTNMRFPGLTPIPLDEDLSVIGYSMINPSPFALKDYERRDLQHDSYVARKPILMSWHSEKLSEQDPDVLNRLPSIEEELTVIGEKPAAVWIMHAPPYGGNLDLTGKRQHVGSKAILQAIQKHQPLLTLHGHIHESPYLSGQWYEYIGRTLSVNPGSGTDKLHAVTIEIDEKAKTVVQCHHTIFSSLND